MLKLKDDGATGNTVRRPVSVAGEEMKDVQPMEWDEPYVSQSIDKPVVEDVTAKNDIEESQPVNVDPQKEVKKDNPIATAAVLIGFVAWIGALVYFSKTEPKLCISAFGAFWLLIAVVSVVGLIKDGIKDMRNVIIAFVFVYLGVGLTFVPILQMYVPAFQGQFGFRMAMYLVFIFCIILGILMAGVEIYRIIRGRLVYTVEVSAECLKLRDKHFWRDEVNVRETQGYYGRRKKVSGVYRFEYNGQTYEVQDDTNSNVDRPEPGAWYTLRINPQNPNEFYRATMVTHISVLVIGVAFLVVGIICCVVF